VKTKLIKGTTNIFGKAEKREMEGSQRGRVVHKKKKKAL